MTCGSSPKTARAVAGTMTLLQSARWTLPSRMDASQPPGLSLSAGCSVLASSVGTCPSPTPREQGLMLRSTEA
jgi:hypothetical protein